MRYSNFENSIKNVLYNAEEEVDVNRLLIDIKSDGKNKRPFTLGRSYLFVGLVLMTALASFYFLNTDDIISSTYSKNESNHHSYASENKAVSSIANTSTSTSEKIEPMNSVPDIKLDKSNQNGVKTNGSKNNYNNTYAYKEPINLSNSNYTKPTTTQLQQDDARTTNLISNATNNQKRDVIDLINIEKIDLLTPAVYYRKDIEISKKIECPNFTKKSPFKFALIPELGAFMPFKKLSSSDPEAIGVFDLREKNEKTLEGIQTALYLQLTHNNSPIYLNTGVSYSRIAEKMNLSYEKITLDTITVLDRVTMSENGDTLTYYYVDKEIEIKTSGYNKQPQLHTMIDLPLAIGYERNMGSFNLGVEGGVSFNISLTSRGKILNTVNTYSNLPDKNVFKTSLGMNFFAGFRLSKTFNGLGKFYVAARARHIPSPFTQSSYNIKQKYTAAGLHFGYIYDL